MGRIGEREHTTWGDGWARASFPSGRSLHAGRLTGLGISLGVRDFQRQSGERASRKILFDPSPSSESGGRGSELRGVTAAGNEFLERDRVPITVPGGSGCGTGGGQWAGRKTRGGAFGALTPVSIPDQPIGAQWLSAHAIGSKARPGRQSARRKPAYQAIGGGHPQSPEPPPGARVRRRTP